MTPAPKQIEELVLSDFEASPYWMFYAGPRGEFDSFTTLIPETHPDYNEESVRLIRTQYTLADQRVLAGYFYEDTSKPHQHVVFVKEQPFHLWSGNIKPSVAHLAAFYNALCAKAGDIFPISWQTQGDQYAGLIAGFGHYDENHAVSFLQ